MIPKIEPTEKCPKTSAVSAMTKLPVERKMISENAAATHLP